MADSGDMYVDQNRVGCCWKWASGGTEHSRGGQDLEVAVAAALKWVRATQDTWAFPASLSLARPTAQVESSRVCRGDS